MECFRLFLVVFASMQLPRTLEGTTVERVTYMTWEGIIMYLPVDRAVIQRTLDEHNDSKFGQCNRPTLYLPDTPIFPGILNKSQHVVFIDIGYGDVIEFDDNPDPCIDAKGLAFTISIPFLSSKLEDLPHYSLALAKMYDRRSGNIIKPNFAFPYIPIDEVFLEDDSAVIRNGSDEFRFEFTRFDNPCIPAPSIVRHEFENFTKYEMQIGASEPDFDFCDSHAYESEFCSNVGAVRCDLSRAVPNFCQLSWKSDDLVSCKASVDILNITSGFRDLMLIDEGPINVIASESFSGHFPMGIKYPCI